MVYADPQVQHLVCVCNSTWSSILPPPPCPFHSPRIYNGLCNCPAQTGLHPFHLDQRSWFTTPTTTPKIVDDYRGRHRR